MICKYQTLYSLAADDVRLDDFVDIVFFYEPIPDRLGIDDDGLAVFALLEASRLVGSYRAANAVLSQLLLEFLVE